MKIIKKIKNNPFVLQVADILRKAGDIISEKKLIVFDLRTVLLLTLSAVTFLLLVVFKINYSSISMWDKIAPGNEHSKSENILGEGKNIRSDEWLLVTPSILAQSKQKLRFPVTNESIGAAKAPLIMSLPIAHFSTFFRPQNWGFFLFDIERAYSFYWNFKVFGLLLSFFLLLMLLTKNNFWVSLLGSLWLFFSGFMQWWFSTPAMLPEMITSFCMILLSSIYLVFSEKKAVILLSSFLMTIFGVNFILFFYPPFQIPLIYLAFSLFVGYLLKNFNKEKFKKLLPIRLISLGVFFVITMVTLFLFYNDAKETIQIVLGTVYPGKRFEHGGVMNIAWIFSGYFSFFWNETSFPKALANICEASNFVMFFPVVLPLVTYLIFKRKISRKELSIEIFLSVYLLLILVWAFWGFPHFLAKTSLFYLVQPTRSILGLGIANIVLVSMYISGGEKKIFPRVGVFFIALIFMILAMILGFNSSKQLDSSSFTKSFVMLTSISMATLAWALMEKKKFLFFIPLLTLLIFPNFPINPVVRGLGSIYDKDIVRYVSKVKKDNNGTGKWLVFGNHAIADLLKTTGANVINGSDYLPDFSRNNILDPEHKFRYIYNRYAHVVFEASDNKDEALYKLNQGDVYTVSVSPCADIIRNIGVEFVVIPDNQKNADTNCLKPLISKPLNGMNIYTYRY